MSLWRQVSGGLRVLFRRGDADADVADEVQHYLDLATAAHVRRGLTPDHASRAARLELGNNTVVREQVRSFGWENGVVSVLADVRFALRRLRANPGFTTVAVLTLALGIGATSAIFSAANPILFEPLPYPHADRILTVWDRSGDGSRATVTFGTYRELAARARSFDALAAFKDWQPTLIGGGATQPERLDGQRVSADYFRALGVAPAIGRAFEASEDRLNGPDVAVLSDDLWRRRFGGDSTIIGRRITLDDKPYAIVGVMPRGFENVLASSAQIWSPLQYDASLPSFESREWGHHLRMIARAKAGVAVDQAGHELELIARSPDREMPRPPWASLRGGLIVTSLKDDVTRVVRPALIAILGAVLLVLVIAAVNVTNLLLSRGVQRRRELAMRAALGAGRSRLVRQLLTESVVLALIGGALGLIVARACVGALIAVSPPELPRLGAVRVNAMVFAFAFGVSAFVGIIVGLLPALRISREDARTGLHEAGRRATGAHAGAQGALVVAEVALALVLLVGAGLLLRSVERLFSIAPGFEAAQVLTMQVQVSGRRFDDAATRRFYAQSLEAVRGVPGVDVVAFTSQLPLSGDADIYGAQLEHDNDAKDDHSVFRYAISPSYFAAMRIPLRHGRLLDERDISATERAVVVNEAFAKRKFPDQDAVGQRIRVGGQPGRPWDVIVGVVGDVKQSSLAMDDAGAVYVLSSQWLWADNPQWLVVRARGGGAAAALAPAVQRAVWSVDKDQPIVRVATMEHLLDASEAQRRFALTVFEAFGLVALVLAATGIYGVLSGRVTERFREIGIRSALGASRGSILALVVRQGMSVTGLGVALGVGAAMLTTQAVTTLLYGVSRLDPITYVGVVVLLALVSLAACAFPAWRAARVDPSITLRSE